MAQETGLRVSDVVRLRADHIQPGPVLTVTERKTGKERTCPISPILASRLNTAARRGRGWCFPGESEGAHLHRDTIGKQIRAAASVVPQLAGFVISMHSARKNYAQRLMDDLHDIEAVRKILQHSNIATTLLYIYGAPTAR